MTVPLIRELKKNNYEVHGICQKNKRNLSKNKIDKVHFIDLEKKLKDQFEIIFENYSDEDILIFGNPLNIEAVNQLNPNIKHLSPSQDKIQEVVNKSKLNSIAESLCLKVPKNSTNNYPIIAKLKNSENTNLKPNQRYRIIKNEKEYVAAKDFIDKNHNNLIFQEYVEGPSYGVSMLMDDNCNMLDYIVHKRVLEYPITGGPSSLCETVKKEYLVESTKKLLKHLGWKGFAMVEYKDDYLIEINPRFWGSMPIIFRSNGSFFDNYINYLVGEPLINQNNIPYKLGVKMKYFPQGLLSVLSLMKTKNWKKGITGYKNLLISKEGIFKLRDPKPFIWYLQDLLRRNL